MGFADTKAIATKITSATTDTQIFTSPWRAQRKYYLHKLILTNEQLSTVATVKFYDKDGAAGAPPVRGDNANAPLLEFIVPALTTLSLSELQCPREFFISGCVANSSVANVVVMVEINED
jgi:hypothetical protein